MPIVLDGTAGIDNDATDLSYTGTLTGGTGVVNLGSGQFYKDASGNVGIGTSSPAALLHVQNDQGGSLGRVLIDANVSSGYDARITATNVGLEFTAQSNSRGFAFSTGSTPAERMRIDSSGNLLVGTTSGNTHVIAKDNATVTPALQVQALNASFASSIVNVRSGRSTTNGTYNFFRCADGSDTSKLVIADSGNVTNTNNSYGGISDAKIKENIVDASPKLKKLNQVRVVNYNLKIDPDQKLLGVVAQELEQIFPGMVEETPDRDAEGNDLGTVTKSVKYSVFVPMLIKAIQEQQAMIESLTARVVALETQA